jgi:peptidoglycan-N-acetylglucosamine deacetylase
MTGHRPPERWPEGIVSRVDDKPGVVALTFDDGPNLTSTAAVREVLNSYEARGTFFEVGRALEAEPSIALDLDRDGHLIANHSHTHSLAAWLSPNDQELADSQDAFGRLLGKRPAFFRPPFGLITRATRRQLDERGMTCVTWNVAVQDWKLEDPSEIARRVLQAIGPGAIVLLHDGHNGEVAADRRVIVDALPTILEGMRGMSLEPVRLDDLLETPGYLP